jgi:hypothetical protein
MIPGIRFSYHTSTCIYLSRIIAMTDGPINCQGLEVCWTYISSLANMILIGSPIVTLCIMRWSRANRPHRHGDFGLRGIRAGLRIIVLALCSKVVLSLSR